MIVAGIDYSISSPGLCILDTSKPTDYCNLSLYFNMHNPTNRYVKTWDGMDVNLHPSMQSQYDNEIERYLNLADWAMSVVLDGHVDKVFLEDYAMGAKGRVFNIAECTAMLKLRLYEHGIPVVTVAPTKNKKLFTGKGNANKATMISTFNDRFSVDICVKCMLSSGFAKSPVSDIVDATALALSYAWE